MNSLPQNLRIPDLIAKTSKVTLKDTVRVLHAIEAVQAMYGPEAANHAALDAFRGGRPTPENIAACERASFDLKEGETPCREEIDKSLRAIKSL